MRRNLSHNPYVGVLAVTILLGACFESRGKNPYDPLLCSNGCQAGELCYGGTCIVALTDAAVGDLDAALEIDAGEDSVLDLPPPDQFAPDVNIDAVVDQTADVGDLLAPPDQSPPDITLDIPIADQTFDTLSPADATSDSSSDANDMTVDAGLPPTCGYDDLVATDVLSSENSFFLRAFDTPSIHYFDSATGQLRRAEWMGTWFILDVSTITGDMVSMASISLGIDALAFRTQPTGEIYVSLGTEPGPGPNISWTTPQLLNATGNAAFQAVNSFEICYDGFQAHLASSGNVDTGGGMWTAKRLVHTLSYSGTFQLSVAREDAAKFAHLRVGCGQGRVNIASADKTTLGWNVESLDRTTMLTEATLDIPPPTTPNGTSPIVARTSKAGGGNLQLFFGADLSSGYGPLYYYTWSGFLGGQPVKSGNPLLTGNTTYASSIDLVVDSLERPHIAYRHGPSVPGTASLKWAFLNGASWYTEVISTDAGEFSKIAIADNGDVHITWIQEVAGKANLMHSCRTPP